jgi:hypothetical protein
MAVVLGLLLVAAGAIGFALSRDEDDAPAEATSAASGATTGILVSVDDDRLLLDPGTGDEPLTFAVRPIDYRRIDIPHLNEHVEERWPVRIHWTLEGDTRYAERVDDA